MPGPKGGEMGEVSVMLVYDIASEIGKECEKLIDKFGSDAVATLIPQVINALELLEGLANRNESENSTVQELNDRITQLETEKLEKAEYRKRFEKELETIEEQWRSESSDLVALVSRLQDENKRLATQIQSGVDPDSGVEMQMDSTGGQDDDFQLLQRLRSQVEKQRNELMRKDMELEEKVADIESVNMQIERLKTSGRESRRRHKVVQLQVRTLCEERADFLAQLQDQHREIVSLRRRLGLAEKENEDLVKTQEEEPLKRYTTTELKELMAERDDLRTRINDLEEELKVYRPNVVEQEEPEQSHSPSEEDPPVQGPLPFEPDDAPWKKSSESGIRKFFRKLFSDPDDTSASFPRRSLSTLSKMALSAGPHCDIPF
uniref:Putative myosin class ii heavy chain n=1 Tax=Phlebotomus kandelakii TaxID=1109342 RepID=A0A6B2EGF0_9DIPT